MLDVVIVSYRCGPMVRECLQSLSEYGAARGLRVTVVDNASGDGTADVVRREFPEVRLIALDENVGFSAANNLVLRETTADYVLVLNPDTRLCEGTLDTLLNRMDADPRIGIAGCRLVQEDGTFDHAARRSFPTPASALGHFLHVGRSERAPAALAAYRAPDVGEGPVDAVNGAFMLMRRAMLDAIGLFDEGYWMYMEDLDLCYRAAGAGWITWYEPSVEALHIKAGTSGDHRRLRLNYAFHYGIYRYYRAHLASQRGPLFNVLVYVGIALKFLIAATVSAAARAWQRLSEAARGGRRRVVRVRHSPIPTVAIQSQETQAEYSVHGLRGRSVSPGDTHPPRVRTQRSDERRPAGAVDHVLVVAYLYPPCSAVPAHRPAGLRRAFVSAGIRATVLTSEISGSYEDDGAQRIIRAGDLRTRFRTQYQTLVGYREGRLESRAKPRWWTKYIVPDPTAVSWFPLALLHLLKLIRTDRPDLVITTSGPESTHLLGLVASVFGIPWVADYRDPWLPWLRDDQHPAILRLVDRALERRVAHRASIVTAVNDPVASDIARRHGVRAFTISNGFDRAAVTEASNEEAIFDPSRFSLVHTGLLAIDADEPVLSAAPHRARDVRMFLDALTILLAQDSELAARLELVLAGPISEREREELTHGELGKVVRVLGQLTHKRALGLQQAADGLLLIPGGADATSAKIFEYLAARKPIFALTEHDSAAAELLRDAGGHAIVEPGDSTSVAAALENYLSTWTSEISYEPRPGFDLEAYEYENLGRKLLQLVAGAGSEQRTQTTIQAT